MILCICKWGNVYYTITIHRVGVLPLEYVDSTKWMQYIMHWFVFCVLFLLLSSLTILMLAVN